MFVFDSDKKRQVHLKECCLTLFAHWRMYSLQEATVSVHSLLNLADYTSTFRRLQEFSTFYFEYFMHQVKRGIEGGTNFCPLLRRPLSEMPVPPTMRELKGGLLVEFKRNETLAFIGSYTHSISFLEEAVIVKGRPVFIGPVRKIDAVHEIGYCKLKISLYFLEFLFSSSDGHVLLNLR